MTLAADSLPARAKTRLAAAAAFGRRQWTQAYTGLRSWLTIEPVLKPYTPDPKRWTHYVWRSLAMLTTIAFCFLYGAAFCMFAPGLLVVLLIPLGLIIALAIWALPDSRAAPVAQLGALFFCAQASTILWPNYLSVVIPGLPWISLTKLFIFPMDLALLICVSTSVIYRKRLFDVFKNSRLVFWSIAGLFFVQTASIMISHNPFSSLSSLIIYNLSVTAAFVASVYIFSHEGSVQKWSRLIWVCAIIVCLIAIPESFVHHALWYGHIPSFIQTSLESYSEGGDRGGNYRAEATFDGSIQLAEFLSLSSAFIIHETLIARRWLLRAIGAGTMLLILVAAVLSGSRSGLVGLFAAPLLYSGVWIFRFWRRRRDSVMAAAGLFGFPAAAAFALCMTFVIPALKYRLWNNHSTGASTEARKIQWSMAIPKIAAHPWGYGASESGLTLGYIDGNGNLSVDSYPITLLIDYGVIGAALWYAGFILTIFYAGRAAIESSEKEMSGEISYLTPAAVALINFLIIKSVFSQIDNHGLFYAVMGMALALLWRRAQVGAAQRVSSYAGAPVPLVSRRDRTRPLPAHARIDGRRSTA